VFDFPPADLIKLYSTTHFKDDLKNTIRHYLAFVDEKPVAAGSIICIMVRPVFGTYAPLMNTGGKGSDDLLQRMLDDAAESGYELIMLYATP